MTNEEFLIKNGYEYDGDLVRYWFMYKDGNYRAVNTFSLHEVIEAPLSYINAAHNEFMELAKKHCEF